MAEPLSIAACRVLLGTSAASMTDGDIEKLRDALYGISETLCAEVHNADPDALWHESFLAHATKEDMDALLREDAQFGAYWDKKRWDAGMLGFDAELKVRPN